MDSVNCEICGRTIAKGVRVKVEGTVMEVCNNCSSMGEKLAAPRQWTPKQQNLKLSQETVVDNYASLVKQAREKRKWTMEEFALRAQEKEMFLHRVEQGSLTPDPALARKLERVLGIQLIAMPKSDAEEETKAPVQADDEEKTTGLTLGDFIKVKKKK